MENSYLKTLISITGATCIQQTSTYWLKTVIKNQYVYGKSIPVTFNNLFQSKETFRFYRGIIPNIMKALVSRNSDILFHKFYSKNLNSNKEYIAMISGLSSSIVKVGTMPFDTVSNLYQIHGKKAKDIITKQFQKEDYFYYRGTGAYLALTTIGSSAWLYTYSQLSEKELHKNKNVNNALIGVGSSVISDIVVNPFRILKTYKQSNSDYITYSQIVKRIIKEEQNYIQAYFRGYGLRMGLNAFNSGIFMVLWKNFDKSL